MLPWAGLGFMVGFVIRGVRQGGWRYPALFGLVWFAVSGINASGPVYAAVAPALWLLYAVFVVKEHTLRQAWATVWRIVVLTAGVSLWWAYALAIESGFGLNVLGTTEKVSAVAKTSLASEVIRGLGYWFFYGSDIAGPWAVTSTGFTQQLWLIGVSSAVPLVALGAAVFVRWRHRAFFIVLVVVGMVLAVGSNPYAAPSTVGGFIKTFMTKTTAGLALRSTNRATPMVLLGLAMLLGAGITALARRRLLVGLGAAGLALVLVAAANPPVWNGSTVLDRYTFPTPVPGYVTQAAKALNAENTRHRVLAIPGENDAAYRYANTVDPIWPGLLTRPFITREQLVLGSLPSYDMTYAMDVPMQQQTADPEAIAPMARLMSVGDVLVQNDLAYDLYDRPSPQLFWQSLHLPLDGLSAPVGYGPPTPNISAIPMVDESTLAAPPDRALAVAARGPGSGETPARRAGRVHLGRARRGRRRRRAQRRGRARPARHHVTGPLLGDPRQRQRRLVERAPRGRHAGGDRQQPQAVVPVEHRVQQRRDHPRGVGPQAQRGARHLPRRARKRADHGAVHGGGVGHRSARRSRPLRRHGHRRAARHGVDDPHRVLGSREVLAGDHGEPGDGGPRDDPAARRR